MLLSDRDLRAEIESGRVGVDPYDPAMIQPSSVDLRLDRYFRVFQNHRYGFIDPAEQQEDLTELIEPAGEEPFILHPGEFVLGSTYETVSLPDDLAGRLEGKSLARPLGPADAFDGRLHRSGLHRPRDPRAVQRRNAAHQAVAGDEDRPALPAAHDQPPAEFPYGSTQAGSRYQGQRGPTPSRSYLNFSAHRRLTR